MISFVKWNTEDTHVPYCPEYRIRDDDGYIVMRNLTLEMAEQRCREHNAFPVLVEALEEIEFTESGGNVHCPSCGVSAVNDEPEWRIEHKEDCVLAIALTAANGEVERGM